MSDPEPETDSDSDLRVPSSFKDKSLDDADVRDWNLRAQAYLSLHGAQHVQHIAGVAQVAQLFPSFPLSSSASEPWLSPATSQLAQTALEKREATPELVASVLEAHVKPVLRANPHPRLSLSTGRAMARSAGGALASQDYLQAQAWKAHPGLANLVGWCIHSVSAEGAEQIWFLLVPPVMTFLDDYEARYKLRGVQLASRLLDKLPAPLLLRTGIGALLSESLTKSLLFLHDPLSPALIHAAVSALLALTAHTTPPASSTRHAQLSALLGEHLLGGAWVYAASSPPTIRVSLAVLPALVAALGPGTARFLRALVLQCCHCLALSLPALDGGGGGASVLDEGGGGASASDSDENAGAEKGEGKGEGGRRDKALQLAALDALRAVMEACRPRLFRWRGAIVAGVGRLWVGLCADAGVDMRDEEDTRERVVALFRILAEACPGVVEKEYRQILQKEPRIFQDVLVVVHHH